MQVSSESSMSYPAMLAMQPASKLKEQSQDPTSKGTSAKSVNTTSSSITVSSSANKPLPSSTNPLSPSTSSSTSTSWRSGNSQTFSIMASDPGAQKAEHVVSSTGILCAVCGDQATGRYFGAHICEACKSFFIRSTRKGEPTFRCMNNQNCTITPFSRLLCQYCRYQNCMKAGMGRKAKQPNKDLAKDQVPCKVCGDVSSGIHFGVYTCEGCKGFFRRSLRDRNTYCCSGKEECVITPVTRNLCRYCRFKKCLNVGMSRACIKLGRHQKYDTHLIEDGRSPLDRTAAQQSSCSEAPRNLPTTNEAESEEQSTRKDNEVVSLTGDDYLTDQEKGAGVRKELKQEGGFHAAPALREMLKRSSLITGEGRGTRESSATHVQRAPPSVISKRSMNQPSSSPDNSPCFQYSLQNSPVPARPNNLPEASPSPSRCENSHQDKMSAPSSHVSFGQSLSQSLPLKTTKNTWENQSSHGSMDIPSLNESDATSKNNSQSNSSGRCPFGDGVVIKKEMSDAHAYSHCQMNFEKGNRLPLREDVAPDVNNEDIVVLDSARRASDDTFVSSLIATPSSSAEADIVEEVLNHIATIKTPVNTGYIHQGDCFSPIGNVAQDDFRRTMRMNPTGSAVYAGSGISCKDNPSTSWYPAAETLASVESIPSCSSAPPVEVPILSFDQSPLQKEPSDNSDTVPTMPCLHATSSTVSPSKRALDDDDIPYKRALDADDSPYKRALDADDISAADASSPQSFRSVTSPMSVGQSPFPSPASHSEEQCQSSQALLSYDRLYTCPYPGHVSANVARNVALVCHNLLQKVKGGLLTDRVLSSQSELDLMNLTSDLGALQRDSILFELTRSLTGYSAVMRCLLVNESLQTAAEYLSMHRECNSGVHWDKFHETVSLKIIASVQYIKKIPGFGTVALGDRLNLIKHSVFPIILIHKAWKMGQEWKWMEDTFYTNNFLRRMGDGFRDVTYSFVNQFNLASFDSIEVALLMILVVLNPDLAQLEDKAAVLKLHKDYRTIFQKYCQETHGKMDNYLMMMQFVPYLSSIDLVHKRSIRQCEQSNVSMPALFAEINLSS